MGTRVKRSKGSDSTLNETPKENNILWLADNTDSIEGVQKLYSRFHYLQNDKRVPWILLNICCDGTENAEYSAVILHMLKTSKKPIKTQVLSAAKSFGILFACVGEERKAWPEAQFMHHSYQLQIESASLEDLEATVNKVKNEEKYATGFMKQQMGERPFKALMSDFKKIGYKDLEFNAAKAVEYNIVHGIGVIEPFFF